MTPQEIYWENKYVWVVGLLSKSGKIHRYLKPYIGRGGFVVGEAKNGMLLVEFCRSKNRERRAIPAGCVAEYTKARLARSKANGQYKLN